MTTKEEKFDEFIESYDKSLNKDTSTISSIVPASPSATLEHPLIASNQQEHQQQPPSTGTTANTIDNKATPSSTKDGVVSPILSTPTKSNRNSVSLDKQPLKAETSDVKTVSLIDALEKSQSPPLSKSNSTMNAPTHQRQVSSSDIKPPSAKKKGFNLNLALNHEKTSAAHKDSNVTTFTRPRTPSTSISPLQRKLSFASKHEPTTRARSSSIKQLEENEAFSNALRELAAKEMRIFEIKSEIKLLTETLGREQDDLARLRNEISTNLHKDLSSMKSPPPKPILKELPATPINHTLVTSTPQKDIPSIDTSIAATAAMTTTATEPSEPNQRTITPREPTSSNVPAKEVKTSRRISQYWSKPINFINQFDQILQNEFEKLNTSTGNLSVTEDEADQQSLLSTGTPSAHNSPMKQDRERSKTDDVLKNVSNSIWSFMSDVKSGLLGEEENAMVLNQNQVHTNEHHLNQDINEDVTTGKGKGDRIFTGDNGTVDQEMITITK